MSSFLDQVRRAIGPRVRELREARRWTQRELAQKLELSQGRLSELERGGGSFTAEQLVLLGVLFNLPLSHFAPSGRADEGAQLQNALARLGASQLGEHEDALPSERFEEVAKVVKEALVVGSPRLVLALAPILVNRIDSVSLPRIWLELRQLRLERRLAWLADNVLAAVRGELQRALPREVARQYRRAEAVLSFWVKDAIARRSPDAGPDDLLDATIRSERTLEDVRAQRSDQSRRWGLVTGLTSEDFAQALRAAR